MDHLKNGLELKRLDERDIPDLVALSASIGWDYTAEELRTVFASGFVYGHRSADGILASSAAIFPYGDQLASIGTVMVNPDFRRLGLGKAVTQACIDAVPSSMPIMLIATVSGQLLYEHIGFQTVETNYKFLSDRYQPARLVELGDTYTFSPLKEDDLETVYRLDFAARGADRSTFLETKFAQAVDHVLVKQTDGTPVGYAFTIQGAVNRVIGPIVAPDHEVAIAIVDYFAQKHDGKLRVDVPAGDAQAHLRDFLSESGFENVTQPPVMLLNAEALPPRNNTLFAIAQQAYG